MLERQGSDSTPQQPQQLGTEAVVTDSVVVNEMPTLEAEGGQVRRGVKMLLPKPRNPYRGPYSVSGMKPASQTRSPLLTSGQIQQPNTTMQQQFEEVNTAPVHISSSFQEQQGQGDFSAEQQQVQLQEGEDAGSKGKFNCPFCTATFDDTPQLYKHIHEDHGTPRCSTRKARRKGTIIVDDDGSMHIVGEQNTLWELNEENMRRYRRAKRYSPRTSRYTPRTSALPKEEAAALFREDEEPSVPLPQISADAQEMVAMQSIDDGELTLQIVQNGAASTSQPVVKHVTAPVQITPETITSEKQTADISEVTDVSRRAFNCPKCPRLFTKSSELYIHLQNSHRSQSSRGRGRGRGAYHQLHIVDTSELQDQELVEGQPPTMIQLEQHQDLGLLAAAEPADNTEEGTEREVEIRLQFTDETVSQEEAEQHGQLQGVEHGDQQERLIIRSTEPTEHEADDAQPDPPEEEEDLPTVKVSRRGRPPKVKKEKSEKDSEDHRAAKTTGKRKFEDNQEDAETSMTEGETPRRGRSAASSESPKKAVGRPPKRGRRH